MRKKVVRNSSACGITPHRDMDLPEPSVLHIQNQTYLKQVYDKQIL